ncbi:hypothetical protein ABT040_30165 [Streptomyces sp. NPDC002688]|uniref:hypothetical protein n=1 Tax=Streptomyces sp. NPDC002688 TaxID=3154423 RepID=UPI00331CCE9C
MSESTDRIATDTDFRAPSVARTAMEALHTHTQSCEQCTDNYRECPTGRALVRTVRDSRRGVEPADGAGV